MSLQQTLREGTLGVRLPLPAQLELLSQDARHLRWVDRELGLVMLVVHSPFPIDLGEARRAGLRDELEREARRQFDATYAQLAREAEQADAPLPPGQTPRTEDPTWSPIVEAGVIEHQRAPVLRTLVRLSYQPGHELTCGQLALPLAEGHLFVQLMHRAQMTGLRESVLSGPLLAACEGPGDFEHPGQAYYDNPELDEQFPEHGLTCVRRGLAALLADTGGIEVLTPAPSPPTGQRISLPESACSIVPPPGFVYVSRELMPMAPTLSSLVRLALDPDPEALLDVWRTSERAPDAASLRAIADRTARGWADEGAQDVRVESHILDDAGAHALAVQSEINFVVQGSPRRNLCRWFVAEDGSVMRIGLSFPGAHAFSAWQPPLDALVASWRSELSRLPERPESPARKPWWQRLFSN